MSRILSRRLAGLRLASLLAVIVLAVLVTTVQAQGLDTPSPLLPPLGGTYLTPGQVHATYNGPGLQIVLSDVRHSGFSNVVHAPGPGGTLETFDSELTAHVAVDIGPDSFFDVFFDISMSGPTSVFVGGNYNPGNLGTFPTEMLSLNLVGITPMGPALVRESPTQPSTGQTSIAPIGPGMFHIDSFFDVFTEISLDNGVNWIPSTGPALVTLVPEPSSLALLACGAIALAAGVARRRIRHTL
jgi:hypothetical protein